MLEKIPPAVWRLVDGSIFVISFIVNIPCTTETRAVLRDNLNNPDRFGSDGNPVYDHAC